MQGGQRETGVDGSAVQSGVVSASPRPRSGRMTMTVIRVGGFAAASPLHSSLLYRTYCTQLLWVPTLSADERTNGNRLGIRQSVFCVALPSALSNCLPGAAGYSFRDDKKLSTHALFSSKFQETSPQKTRNSGVMVRTQRVSLTKFGISPLYVAPARRTTEPPLAHAPNGWFRAKEHADWTLRSNRIGLERLGRGSSVGNVPRKMQGV